MVKDTQILVRLESKQKNEWQNHAEAHGKYRDLTDLVEQAVEKQISEDSSDFTIDDDFDLVLNEIEQVKDQNTELKELNKKIERTQARSQQLEDAMERILNAIDRDKGDL